MPNNGTHVNDVQPTAPAGVDQNRKSTELQAPLEVTAESKPTPADEAKTKSAEVNNAKLNDTKVAFDSLRNMGICIAMPVGLPALINAAPFSFPTISAIFSTFVLVAALYLAYLNCRWTMQKLKEQPTNKWMHKAGQIFLLSIALLVMFVFVLSAFIKLVLPSLGLH